MAKSSQRKIEYNKHLNKQNIYANQEKYHREHKGKTYTLRLFSHENDIIEYMEKQLNKAGKLKELIRAEIQREKEQG